MNPLLRKFLPLLIIMTFFLSAFLIWKFAITPMRLTIEERLDSMQALRILREAKKNRIDQLPELERQYTLLSEKKDALRVFAYENDIVRFIQMIEKIADESRVQIEIIAKEKDKTKKKSTPQEKPEVSGKGSDGDIAQEAKKKKDETILGNLPFEKYLLFSLQVTGTYPQVASFFHHLETLPSALDVLSFDIKKIENEDAKPIIGFSGAFVAPSLFPGVGMPESHASSNLDAPQDQVEGVFEIVVYTR